MEMPPRSSDATFGLSELLTVWQVVSDRRASYDAMMWQTPTLGMTAQAFLLTLALANGTSDLARVTAACLSILISLMVVQLLAKHRRNEFLDSLALEEIEEKLDLARHAGFRPHSKNRYSAASIDRVNASGRFVLLGPSRFWGMSSFNLWCYGQYIFILGASGIVLLVALGRGGVLNA